MLAKTRGSFCGAGRVSGRRLKRHRFCVLKWSGKTVRFARLYNPFIFIFFHFSSPFKKTPKLLSLSRSASPKADEVQAGRRRTVRRAGHRGDEKWKMGGGAEAICTVDMTGTVGVRGGGGKW